MDSNSLQSRSCFKSISQVFTIPVRRSNGTDLRGKTKGTIKEMRECLQFRTTSSLNPRNFLLVMQNIQKVVGRNSCLLYEKNKKKNDVSFILEIQCSQHFNSFIHAFYVDVALTLFAYQVLERIYLSLPENFLTQSFKTFLIV